LVVEMQSVAVGYQPVVLDVYQYSNSDAVACIDLVCSDQDMML
jgi:hypothetical protein